MNIFSEIKNDIIKIVNSSLGFDDEAMLKNVAVQPSKDAKHGDMATNVAMILARPMKNNPRVIAEKIVPAIAELPDVEKVEIAGAGFINITFENAFWQRQVPTILADGMKYGASNIGNGEKINIEYASPNPTGPMHVGHARGAIYGDILANLFAHMGYSVTRESYMNDAGGQIATLIKSVYLRYREALGEDIGAIPEGLYPGNYLVPVGQALKEKYGDILTADSPEIKPFAISEMVKLIKADLAKMGVYHDVFTSEQAIRDAGEVEKSIASLEEKGCVYTGVLEAPKGKQIEDWEARPQLLFKSTDFGDDVDRPLKKSDGSWTYFAPDIALHYNKFQRGFGKMVLVLGADHGGYTKRIKAAVKALTDGKGEVSVILCNLVKFLDNGQELKMSKRAGTFISVDEVVERVGKDVLRFMMLTRKNDAPFDFDMQKAVEQSKDNPVFYVQYAHARCKSVLRNAVEISTEKGNIALLNNPAEISLMKKMSEFPRILESATESYEPHRIAFYLEELAAQFHSFWNLGNDDKSLRFIIEDNSELTQSRLLFVQTIASVIATGLSIMGVKAVDEMR